MKRTLRLVLVAVSLGWIFFVTFNYYIVHKPFGVENALAILNALGDVTCAGVLVALAAALGRRVLRSFQFDFPFEALILQTGIGLGLLALATFLLGLFIVDHVMFWALLLIAAFLLRNDLRTAWRDLRESPIPIPSRFERILAAMVALVLVVAGLVALTPPIAWDAQTYHLVIPKIALEQGRITTPPDIVYFNFPSLGEMLFLAAMLAKGDITAQVVHFSFYLLTLGAVFAFALRYFNARVAWLACAILVAVPSLVIVATAAYVDLMLAFYAFAAFYALMLAFERRDERWFALAGAFAGCAVSIKYTAAIVPVALVILILLRRHLNAKSLVLFAGTWGLLAAPYYIRNWVYTGNPVYPFVFGGIYWDAFRAEWFSRFGTGLSNSPLPLILAPWNATINGSEGAAGFEATIGPLLLLALPLLVLANSKFQIRNSKSGVQDSISRPEQHFELKALLVYSGLFYLFWLFGIAESKLLLQTRLLFPAFPTFTLLAAIAFDRLAVLNLPGFSLQRFARLVLLLVVGLTALSDVLGFASGDALGYLAGAESRDAYLSRHLGAYYAATKFVNANLPKDARVLFLWEPRSYYANRSTQPDAILDAWAHLRWQYRDADSIAAALCEHGYTHVLLNRAGLDFMLQTGYDPISLDDARVLQEWMARHGQQMYGTTSLEIVTRDDKPAILNAADDPYAVYRLDTP